MTEAQQGCPVSAWSTSAGSWGPYCTHALPQEARFKDNADRLQNRDALHEALQALLAGQERRCAAIIQKVLQLACAHAS
jgi:crotonobetainyl-CoA:carnitine CoA-transferase CaiB-like acyl-CoA transferase